MTTQHEVAFNTRLGRQVMILRLTENMSLHQLGQHLGVSGVQVQKYETGESRMPPEKIQRCCILFDVSPGYFFGTLDTAALRDGADLSKSLLATVAALHGLPEDICQTVRTLSQQVTTHLRPNPPANTSAPPPKKDAA